MHKRSKFKLIEMLFCIFHFFFFFQIEFNVSRRLPQSYVNDSSLMQFYKMQKMYKNTFSFFTFFVFLFVCRLVCHPFYYFLFFLFSLYLFLMFSVLYLILFFLSVSIIVNWCSRHSSVRHLSAIFYFYLLIASIALLHRWPIFQKVFEKSLRQIFKKLI